MGRQHFLIPQCQSSPIPGQSYALASLFDSMGMMVPACQTWCNDSNDKLLVIVAEMLVFVSFWHKKSGLG